MSDIVEIDTGTEQVLGRIEDRVAVLTLNRPKARNALSDELTPALRRQFAELATDSRVGALLVTGAGTAFCAGGDVKGMGSGRTSTMGKREAIFDLQHRQRSLTGALRAFPKPTVAALPGPAAGAGMAIALAADIRIAADTAFFATGYARVGLSGDYGISWLLTEIVGTARARQLMFTGERIPAENAFAWGLVNQVVPFDDLPQAALDFARSMAQGPMPALEMIKKNLNDAPTIGFSEALDLEAERLVHCRDSADHREAVNAFVEKRPPEFGKETG